MKKILTAILIVAQAYSADIVLITGKKIIEAEKGKAIIYTATTVDKSKGVRVEYNKLNSKCKKLYNKVTGDTTKISDLALFRKQCIKGEK